MSLPLTQKLSDNNVYRQLNLEMSAKLPQVKRAYEIKVKVLQEAIEKMSGPNKDQLENELANLQNAYRQFSERVSENNSKLYKTVDSLNDLGLSAGADWNKVEDHYNGMSAADQEKHQANYNNLQQNKELITRKPGLKNTTIIGASAVLGVAGISLAAFHYLDTDQVESVFNDIAQNPAAFADTATGAGSVTESHEGEIEENEMDSSMHDSEFRDGLESEEVDLESLMDEDTLQAYIDENLQVEDEMLSLLGLAPDPTIVLPLQHKLQVFTALVSAI